MQILKQKYAFWRLLHSLRLQNKVVGHVVVQIKAHVAFVEEKIKENMEGAVVPAPALEAKLLFAAIDGMANHFLLLNDYPIDEVASLLIQKYKPLQNKKLWNLRSGSIASSTLSGTTPWRCSRGSFII
ncbi:hypothetical protein GCM10023188_10960 [Pontibacter saemangeumensis]|uniref:Uncharacterized protein n=1 Tax=Pontibacter saemangeumensis TaxID=1084525 RepID=A0ABP8LFV5_9BACT